VLVEAVAQTAELEDHPGALDHQIVQRVLRGLMGLGGGLVAAAPTAGDGGQQSGAQAVDRLGDAVGDAAALRDEKQAHDDEEC
jgi:hypothetical protein